MIQTSSGMRKAAVLPDPVSATPMMSLESNLTTTENSEFGSEMGVLQNI